MGYQNIIWLVYMSEDINLSKMSHKDVCIPYTKVNMQVKHHRNMIQSSKEPLNLAYNNISGPHTTIFYRAKYYVIFLCNVAKQLEAIFLKKKIGVLSTFKVYYLRNKKGDKKV